jgi:hypothetical protein
MYGQVTSSITDEDVLRGYIDGVVSCAYTDIISSVLQCIWNKADCTDDSKPIHRVCKKITSDLKALNSLLMRSSTSFYYDQVQPTIADYFVFEAFTVTGDYQRSLLPVEDERQALTKLEQMMKQRPALARYFHSGSLFKRFTGFPNEAEYLAQLAQAAN